jgi:KDO2-lipid IV(A) lauroyltransferase
MSILPLRLMYILSDGLYYPLYYIGRYRQKIVRKNLTESFPEKSPKEILSIEKRFYHFLIDYIFETCKLAVISQEEIQRRMKFTNIDEINAVLRQGKSISLFLGHYCNWEWISSIPLHLTAPALPGQIYHKLHNPVVDKLFLANRKRFGAINIEMRDTLRWISDKVRSEKTTIVGYIADQAPKGDAIQHRANFLNHHTAALVGAEKITKKYGFEAYYVDIKRIKRGYYEAEFVKMGENPQSLPDFELTDLYFQALEKTIRRRPEYYLWSHNRFKKDKHPKDENRI